MGWALSHHFMHCSEASVKDSKLLISSERLFFSPYFFPSLIMKCHTYRVLIFSLMYMLQRHVWIKHSSGHTK